MISQELILFLKENKNLMNQNTKESWEEVYIKLLNDYKESITGEFTQTILDAGINDPASIMGYIPYSYLHESNITNYKIPNNVTSIDWGAFSGCSSLTEIHIPDSVTSIGDEAFAWCDSLTSVVIPDSVTSIGSYVFCNCTSLKEINFKGTKKQAIAKLKVGNEMWRNGSSIEKIICSDGVIEL